MKDDNENITPIMFINGVSCPWDGEKFIIPVEAKNNR
jgi:hypothetical protein